MATFLLIHGAWHGGWCWKKVTPLLREASHQVFTPTLTGLGERSHQAHPLLGLESHVHDIVNVLTYENLSEVILVGHSYAGTLITAVAECMPERIAHLVYLDAFVPQDGQSTIDLSDHLPAELWGERARAEGCGWLIPTLLPGSWDEIVRDVWGVSDEADRQWMVERLSPMPLKLLADPVRLSNPAASALPRTYIRCLHTDWPPFDRSAEIARNTPGWSCHELATGHDAMVTAPKELAGLLLELA